MRRNMGRRGNIGNNVGGPLMTGHLKDIDLELELLKRKREMIEQQQQLLVMEQRYKSSRHIDSYDQSRFNEPQQHGSDRDYTHLYDNGPKQHNQFGRKRQAEPQWQYDGSFKRTNPRKKSNQFQFNPRQSQGHHGPGNAGNFRRPGPRGPVPLMGVKVKKSIGQKIANQKPLPNSHKEFAPKKVSKPRASPAPNKLASQPLAERKTLVNAAIESVSESDVSRMLLPDRVPTQQVSGRLELALGAIMKNIRELIGEDSPHASILRTTQIQRVMKQAIRERIRNVMLGKVVGSLLEILAVYREEFPEETDIDIINIALEAAGIRAAELQEKAKFIESDDPEIFFKQNMNCLLDSQLSEMFTKLEEIYSNSTGSEKQLDLETKAEVKIELDTESKTEEKTKEQQTEDNEEYKKFLNMDVKPRDVKPLLPRLIKKYIPYIIKLLNMDAMYQTTKAAITMKANQKASLLSKFNKKESGENQGVAEKAGSGLEPANGPRKAYALPYYVKIMGRPSLPKRKLMQTFLTQFNPKSIKKHRTIHNLLFVGFSEKNDFDSIVGADGTVVGKSVLSIRICTNSRDSTTGQNGDDNNDADTTVDENQQGDVKKDELDASNEGEIISAELDGQITDLLSSIRKSEEAEDKENNDATAVEPDRIAEDGKETELEDEQMNENGNSQETDNQDNSVYSAEKDQENVEGTKEHTDHENTAEEKEVTENAELSNRTEVQESEATAAKEDSADIKKEENASVSNTGNSQEVNAEEIQSENDKVGELKNNANASGRSTPSRTSARLSNVTPSSIRTRRASRLAQN